MATYNVTDEIAALESIVRTAKIIALYSEDDTADIVMLDITDNETSEIYEAVPIFYHCTGDAEERANGALTGAVTAFAIDDIVRVFFIKNDIKIIALRNKLESCIKDKLAFEKNDNVQGLVGETETKINCREKELPEFSLISELWTVHRPYHIFQKMWQYTENEITIKFSTLFCKSSYKQTGRLYIYDILTKTGSIFFSAEYVSFFGVTTDNLQKKIYFYCYSDSKFLTGIVIERINDAWTVIFSTVLNDINSVTSMAGPDKNGFVFFVQGEYKKTFNVTDGTIAIIGDSTIDKPVDYTCCYNKFKTNLSVPGNCNSSGTISLYPSYPQWCSTLFTNTYTLPCITSDWTYRPPPYNHCYCACSSQISDVGEVGYAFFYWEDDSIFEGSVSFTYTCTQDDDGLADTRQSSVSALNLKEYFTNFVWTFTENAPAVFIKKQGDFSAEWQGGRNVWGWESNTVKQVDYPYLENFLVYSFQNRCGLGLELEGYPASYWNSYPPQYRPSTTYSNEFSVKGTWEFTTPDDAFFDEVTFIYLEDTATGDIIEGFNYKTGNTGEWIWEVYWNAVLIDVPSCLETIGQDIFALFFIR